jgi:hypothetical protein
LENATICNGLPLQSPASQNTSHNERFAILSISRAKGFKKRALSEIDVNALGKYANRATYARRKAAVPVSIAAMRFDNAMAKPLPHGERVRQLRVRHREGTHREQAARRKQVRFQSEESQGLQQVDISQDQPTNTDQFYVDSRFPLVPDHLAIGGTSNFTSLEVSNHSETQTNNEL